MKEMQRLEKEEMLEAINDVRISKNYTPFDFESSEIDCEIEYADGENDEYTIEQVDMIGGYEGAGDDMECTLKITRKLDSLIGYLTFYGYYDSWNESYFHTVECTEPQEKVIIVYEKIK